jgi:hypothetical protein
MAVLRREFEQAGGVPREPSDTDVTLPMHR